MTAKQETKEGSERPGCRARLGRADLAEASARAARPATQECLVLAVRWAIKVHQVPVERADAEVPTENQALTVLQAKTASQVHQGHREYKGKTGYKDLRVFAVRKASLARRGRKENADVMESPDKEEIRDQLVPAALRVNRVEQTADMVAISRNMATGSLSMATRSLGMATSQSMAKP